MTAAELNLIVIRSADLQRAEEFYGALGISFSRERHENEPEHLAAQVGGIVLEIYPKGTGDGTAKVRLGFRVESIASAIERVEQAGGTIVSHPQTTQWGL